MFTWPSIDGSSPGRLFLASPKEYRPHHDSWLTSSHEESGDLRESNLSATAYPFFPSLDQEFKQKSTRAQFRETLYRGIQNSKFQKGDPQDGTSRHSRQSGLHYLEPIRYDRSLQHNLFGFANPSKAKRKSLPWLGKVRLSGKTFKHGTSWRDFYVPRIVPYGAKANRDHEVLPSTIQSPPVEHLDVCLIWRNLASLQAEELRAWQNSLMGAIQELLKGQIFYLADTVAAAHLQQRQRLFGSNKTLKSSEISGLVEKLSHCEATPKVYRFQVKIFDLVNTMMNSMIETGLVPGIFQWFHSTENMYNTVAQFIRVQDCFFPMYDDETLYLQAHICADGSEPGIPACDVKWQPRYISFDDFNSAPIEGQPFTLAPRYRGLIDGGSQPLKTLISFSTDTNWLHFDPVSCVFEGTVPFESSKVQGTQFHVKARVVTFLDSVRQEKTYRVRVNLHVRAFESVNSSETGTTIIVPDGVDQDEGSDCSSDQAHSVHLSDSSEAKREGQPIAIGGSENEASDDSSSNRPEPHPGNMDYGCLTGNGSWDSDDSMHVGDSDTSTS